MASPGFRPVLNTTTATTTKSGGTRRRSQRWAASCCARALRSVARATLAAGSELISTQHYGRADAERHRLQVAETRSNGGWRRLHPRVRAGRTGNLQPHAEDVPPPSSHASCHLRAPANTEGHDRDAIATLAGTRMLAAREPLGRGDPRAHQALRGETAVNGVELLVPRGSAFGYLGPNGAGKTTLIRVLLGLTRADAGTMSLLGYPVPRHRDAALARDRRHRRRTPVPRHLTGRQNLRLLAAAREPAARDRIGPVLERVGLAHRADDRVSGYSMGMRQRLGVAACLLGRPAVAHSGRADERARPRRDSRDARHDPRRWWPRAARSCCPPTSSTRSSGPVTLSPSWTAAASSSRDRSPSCWRGCRLALRRRML